MVFSPYTCRAGGFTKRQSVRAAPFAPARHFPKLQIVCCIVKLNLYRKTKFNLSFFISMRTAHPSPGPAALKSISRGPAA